MVPIVAMLSCGWSCAGMPEDRDFFDYGKKVLFSFKSAGKGGSRFANEVKKALECGGRYNVHAEQRHTVSIGQGTGTTCLWDGLSVK